MHLLPFLAHVAPFLGRFASLPADLPARALFINSARSSCASSLINHDSSVLYYYETIAPAALLPPSPVH